MKYYLDRKDKGLVRVKKVNNAYALYIKQFNRDTGEEIEEDVQTIDKNKLIDEIASLEILLKDRYDLLMDITPNQTEGFIKD